MNYTCYCGAVIAVSSPIKKKITCRRCGVSRVVDATDVRRQRTGKCSHLGSIVGTADCDCQSKPSVYACELHGLCMPRMSVTAAAVVMDDGTRATVSRSCATCDDHATADATQGV